MNRATSLASVSVDGQINPNLIIEAGCWYLCTDTAELFLGTYEDCPTCANCINCTNCANCVDCPDRKLTLKKINSTKLDQVTTCIVKLDIADGNLIATYSDDTVVDLGKAVDYIPTKVSEFVNDAGYITAVDIPTTDLSEYVKKSELPDVSKFITSIPDEYITESELSDLNYATEQYVIDAIAAQVPVEDLAKKDEVEEVKTTLKAEVLPAIKEEILPTVQELAETAATQKWVQEQGYLTEHQSLDEYAKKDELFSKSYNDLTDTPAIPSIEGLVTEDYVDKAIANLNIPEVDLSAYACKSDLEVKADAVPFVTNRYVSNAIGNFVEGESVKGLTVAELFAKLLGLSDVPQGVVDDIIINKYGLYQFNDSVETEKIEFELTEFNTAEEYTAAPDKTTFYQYTYTNDEGKKVTESGYQHYTLAQDFIWYMIMLPSSLVIGENVKVQAWADEPRNMWVDTITTLESNLDVIAANFVDADMELPEIPEGYTMWVDFSNTNPGNIVRYIIIE